MLEWTGASTCLHALQKAYSITTKRRHHCSIKNGKKDDCAKFLAVVQFLDAHKHFSNQVKDTKTRHTSGRVEEELTAR